MKPDWKDAPEWAEWLAMDSDGKWYWYRFKPTAGAARWFDYRCKTLRTVAGTGGLIKNWRKTLEPRPSGIETPDEKEELDRIDQRIQREAGSRQGCKQYSAYFKDVRHIDYIDVYRAVDLFDCEKHGHPISHAAKKLLLTGARTGGKDVETEVREAIDSLYRWLEMREEDRNAL